MLEAAIRLPPELFEAICRRVLELLDARDRAPRSPWLTVAGAAKYLCCSMQRIYDLVSAGRLRCAKDGSRSLFRREWLDECVEEAA